jgi:uncharacterized protein YciI
MSQDRGFVRAPLAIGIAIALGIAAFVVAQDSATTKQVVSTKNGQATATASSSASARASSTGVRSSGAQASGSPAIGGFDPSKRLYAAWYTDNRRAKPNQQQDTEAGMHYKYMKGLSIQGVLIADGPFGDGTGMLTIIQAADDQSAQQLIEADPSVQSKVFSVTLKQWNVVQGQWIGGGLIGRPTPARNGGTVGAPGGGGG